MIWELIVMILLALACIGLLIWGLSLRRQVASSATLAGASQAVAYLPPTVLLAPPEPPAPQPRQAAPAPAEPDIPLSSVDRLADPQALPEAPDSLPDSMLDGARLGRVVVRAAAVRGDLGRRDGLHRRQIAWIGVLSKYEPAVLLSCVTAGLPSREYSQLGAVQAGRSLQGKLSERAVASMLDAAWRQAERNTDPAAGDQDAPTELTALLRDVAASVGNSLNQMARERFLAPDQVATELTFVLTRLGDAPVRQHLAASLGSGRLLRLAQPGSWHPELAPRAGDSQAGLTLPGPADQLRAKLLWTKPGELLAVCSGSAADFLERDQVRSAIASEWLAGPPHLIRYLWQLSLADQIRREDRAAVAVWELARRR